MALSSSAIQKDPSQIRDQAHSHKGKDYIFVDQLPVSLKELECPICQSIVSEPLQTSCGHLFCRECYNKLGGNYSTGWGVECPVCKQEHNTVRDNYNDRRVKNLQVRCTNYQYGCEWVGNLRDELQHRRTPHSCHFEEIPCPHGCGKTIQRMGQWYHFNDCPMRPHKCAYCGEEGPFREIVGNHLETCCKYPVLCPNGCNRNIPREIASKTQRITQLTEKHKKVKTFIVFALGFIVLFRLHPLYFIPLVIIYIYACA